MSKSPKDIEWENLKQDVANANAGTARGMELLQDSLQTYGSGGAVTVDSELNIIGGNKTAEVAAALGFKLKLVPIAPDEILVGQREDLSLYDPTDARARDLAIALNRVAEVNLSWVDDVLKAIENSGGEARQKMWYENERKGMAIRASKEAQAEAAIAEGEQAPLDVKPTKKRPAKPIVIVECTDENEQAAVIDVCEERGWKWRTD